MFGFGSKNIGIDLGTANTLVYVDGKGIVLNEPSVVAKNTQTEEVIAVGEEARDMIGRTPTNIVAIRPMKDGVIADYDTTAAMLKYFMQKALGNGSHPQVMICVPSGVTEVEKRAVIDAAKVAGARDAFVIEEPYAAAIGAGLPVMDSIRVAGDKFDEAIINHLRQNFNLLIGERTAEAMKIQIGSASVEKAADIDGMTVRGRDLLSGLPKTIDISATDIASAIHENVLDIITAIKETLEETSPEIAADVIDHGIVLTGGGALLKHLPDVISDETKVPVFIAQDPLDCVAIGTGESLKNIDVLKKR